MSVAEKPVNKFLAAHIRATLIKGWPPTSRFVRIVNLLPDDELIRQKHEHDEHQAMLQMYKLRVVAGKPKESLITKAMRACLVTT